MSIASSCTTTPGIPSETLKETGLGDCLPVVLNNVARHEHSFDRRRGQRHAFPYPIRLQPATRDARPRDETPIVALGKNLSNHGLEFYFHQAVPYRWMIASLPCGKDRFVEVLLELQWCRFGHEGYYVNVGRIHRVLNRHETRAGVGELKILN